MKLKTSENNVKCNNMEIKKCKKSITHKIKEDIQKDEKEDKNKC
jgi:hypothetical protein